MNTPAAALPVTFAQALRFWLRLGCISFGGPAGQIAIMHRELVEEKRWISEQRFLHALNYCMLLPGPEAQQLATYIGWLMHRTWGGIAAGALFVLPSLLLLIGLSWVVVVFGSVPWVAGVLYGIKPAVAALVLLAVHRLGSKTLKKPALAPVLWAVAAMSFVAAAVFNVPFPAVVLVAAVTGWWAQKHWPAQFSGGASHNPSKSGDTAQAGAAALPLPGSTTTWRRLPIRSIGVRVSFWCWRWARHYGYFLLRCWRYGRVGTPRSPRWPGFLPRLLY
jgi:chromate transporter